MIYGNALMPGGSGKAGATLTVSAPLGSVITISKDGESYSSSLLPAVFKGLSSGTWTRTATLNGQTSEKLIQIVADYADTVEYFAATINVTFPAGSTVECRQGDYVISTTNTSGSHVFTVPNSGAWTVTATDGTNSTSQNVEITANGQSVSVTLDYWHGELYTEGNEWTSTTGGWQSRGWKYDEAYYQAKAHTLTRNTDHFEITLDGSAYACGIIDVIKDVDVTDFSKLIIDIETDFKIADCSLIVIERSQTYAKNTVARAQIYASDAYTSATHARATKEYEILGSLSGKYDIGLYIYNSSAMSSSGWVKMYSLIME